MFITFDELRSIGLMGQTSCHESIEPSNWRNDHVGAIELLPNWLSRAELDVIRNIEEKQTWIAGKLKNAPESARSTSLAWIAPDSESLWLYRKIADTFIKANAKYRFDLRGLNEEPQLLKYQEGGHIDWHHDLGLFSASVRKLALVALIDRDQACVGGHLEISGARHIKQMDIAGSAIIFPPFFAHRVTTVSKASRLSLVAWACGPSFR